MTVAALRRFAGDRKGNVAIIFALLADADHVVDRHGDRLHLGDLEEGHARCGRRRRRARRGHADLDGATLRVVGHCRTEHVQLAGDQHSGPDRRSDPDRQSRSTTASSAPSPCPTPPPRRIRSPACSGRRPGRSTAARRRPRRSPRTSTSTCCSTIRPRWRSPPPRPASPPWWPTRRRRAAAPSPATRPTWRPTTWATPAAWTTTRSPRTRAW